MKQPSKVTPKERYSLKGEEVEIRDSKLKYQAEASPEGKDNYSSIKDLFVKEEKSKLAPEVGQNGSDIK